jgi:catechol 1,2-dioxygenase
LTSDSVFAVKDDLVVDFKPLEGDKEATLELEYNIVLAPKSYEGASETSMSTIGLTDSKL